MPELKNECCIVTCAHTVDDYEKVVAKVLVNLRADAGLLVQALEAIRNGDHHVAEEFVDRTIESLGRSLEVIKNRPNQGDNHGGE